MLYFDSLKQLSAVKQHKDFDVIQDKEAKAFFEKTKKILLQKFGKADKEKKDYLKFIESEVNSLFKKNGWNLKYSKRRGGFLN